MSSHLFEGQNHSVVWELTRRCNLRCAHCASGAGDPRAEELAEDEAQRLAAALPAIGTKAVCLFGGEFSLRPDWQHIGATLREGGMAVSVATNGLSFDRQLARRLLSLGIDGISVSLDAARPELHDEIRGRRGAHAAVLRASRLIAELGFAGKTVITSVTRRNLAELERMPDLLLEVMQTADWMWMINMASCHDVHRFAPGTQLDRPSYLELAATVDTLRRRYAGQLDITGSHDLGYFSWRYSQVHNFSWQGCQAGIETLGIHSDGSVKGCLVLPDRFIEGSVRERPLVDIWRDPSRFLLVRGFRPQLLEGGCSGCPFGRVCKGGCKDIAFSTSGSPYHFPYCLRLQEQEHEAREH